MITLRYKHVDVFTTKPLQGNSLAVFPDAPNLSKEQMQSIAKEFNLSETTFVSDPTKPDANYRNRIFTPQVELPFAGHPSVGTAYVIAKEGKRFTLNTPVTTIKQEIGIGVLPIDIHYDGSKIGLIEMTQGTPRIGDKVTDWNGLAKALRIPVDELGGNGLTPQVSSTGVTQLMVPVKSLRTLQQLKPDFYELTEFSKQVQTEAGVYVFTPHTVSKQADIHARFYASEVGVSEDPATGSAAGALGAYLANAKSLPHDNGEFTIEQGLELGRPSIIHVRIEETAEGRKVKVGGNVVDVMEGQLSI